ncbi:nucleotidyltransferase domain-containing protein [Chiayiivirga flava]|uniref:Putative nucleotidyltransferase n=1 Tax=Chiayiivirga flava TaxID=659595 RepID=A0A7W8D7B9_9GAMM|nr:nucleotidyltransferase domain-containing protein [Chiayiivirga flava]MBB5209291.1 putative nucleotidyltransferase [Chiayiivirga flava]
MSAPATLPAVHAAFLAQALPRLANDARIVGVAAGGSYITDTMDEHSDLDLVVAIEPARAETVMHERQAIAATLGPLLAAFTGEHVGEPRLLIALYDTTPLLHVDLKFVALPDAAQRVEDPVVLFDREGRLAATLATGEARYPAPDAQWIEDRFWIWVHYAGTKIARGELFDAIAMLAYLRSTVLGPLALQHAGARPSGVRRIEQAAPDMAAWMQSTLATHSRDSCIDALQQCVACYLDLRGTLARLVFRDDAERAVMGYLDEIG